MTGEELLAYVRTDVLHDTAKPYLWSDDLIMRYLSEAEEAFARLTYALQDDSSSMTVLQLEAGVATYAVDRKVLHVFSGVLDGYSTDLTDYTRRFIPSQLLTSTGTPIIMSRDESANTIRVYPVPEKAYTLKLRIARLPMSKLTVDYLAACPEIPEQYHLDLAEFVAYRCLKNAEVDGSNLGSSAEFERSWKARVGEAKREYYRYRTGPNATARNNWTGKRN